MISIVYLYDLRATAQAYNFEDKSLHAKLDKPLSYLKHTKDKDALGRCEELCDIMSENLTELTILDEDNITEMQDAIQKFRDISGQPKKAIKERKVEGTNPIPDLFKKIDKEAKQMGKLFKSFLPDFYEKWKADLKIGKPTGSRHTSYIGRFIDAATGVPVPNVEVTFTNGVNTFVLKSTKSGFIRLFSLLPGYYTLTAQHPMYTIEPIKNIGISSDVTINKIIRIKLTE